MTIWRHWCKGCGVRVEPYDGGWCRLEECQSSRAAAIKVAAGGNVETREDVLRRLDEAVAKHPHDGGLKIARNGVHRAGFELLPDGVLSNAKCHLARADQPFGEVDKFDPNAFATAFAQQMVKTSAEQIVAREMRPVTTLAREMGKQAQKGFDEVARRVYGECDQKKREIRAAMDAVWPEGADMLFTPDLVDAWTGLHLDVFAEKFFCLKRQNVPDADFRNMIYERLAERTLRPSTRAEVDAFVDQTLSGLHDVPKPWVVCLALGIPDNVAHAGKSRYALEVVSRYFPVPHLRRIAIEATLRVGDYVEVLPTCAFESLRGGRGVVVDGPPAYAPRCYRVRLHDHRSRAVDFCWDIERTNLRPLPRGPR